MCGKLGIVTLFKCVPTYEVVLKSRICGMCVCVYEREVHYDANRQGFNNFFHSMRTFVEEKKTILHIFKQFIVLAAT